MYHLIQNPHYVDVHRAEQQAALDHAYAVTPHLTVTSLARAVRRELRRVAGWLTARLAGGKAPTPAPAVARPLPFVGMRRSGRRRRPRTLLPVVSPPAVRSGHPSHH